LPPLEFTYPYLLPPGLRQQKPLPAGPLYPLLPIQLYNKHEKPRFFEALLDSGADGVFIPKSIAEILGLEKLGRVPTSGVLRSAHCFQTKVGLTIGFSKARSIEFGIVDAIFPEEDADIPILIGRNPVFRHFEVTFQEHLDKPKIHLRQITPPKPQ
jgi:hypothetical protein